MDNIGKPNYDFEEQKEFKNKRNSEKAYIYRETYRKWKFSSLEKCGYFVIFQGFKETDLLKDISGNSLRLYVYLGLYANNYEGVVWHSNERIAKYFDKSERTIRGWMKELEDVGLIKRMRLDYDGRVYTYLKGYENRFDEYKSYEEGILYFSSNEELCFQGEHTSEVLYLDEYKIKLYTEDEFTFFGKLIRLNDHYVFNDYDKEISYIFNYKKNPRVTFKIRIYR